MRTVRPLSVPPSIVLLLVAASSLSLAQDRGGVGDWLTQPAPGLPGGGAGASSGGQGVPAPGATGWTATPGPNGQTIYTKTPPGASPAPTSPDAGGSGQGGSTAGMGGQGVPAPGAAGWTATPGPNGQTIYTKTPPGASPAPTSPDADGSGQGGSTAGMGGQGVPAPGATGWTVTPGPNGQMIYTKTPPQTGAASPPSSTPAASPTHEVDAGWVADKNGKIKLIYIKNAKDEIVGGREEYYDAKGNLIDTRPFNGSGVASPSTLPTVEDFQGTYSGSISGGAGGRISLYVTGSVVSGSIDGVYKGDEIHARFSGSVDGQGAFASNADGRLSSTDPKTSKVSTYPFTGHVSGRLTRTSASGTWSGANTWGASTGSWRATK